MAINFPASPSTNDTFTAGSITYKWDGVKWIGLGVTPADRLVEGSNSLEINASNELVWTGGTSKFGGVLQGDQRVIINGAGGKSGTGNTLLNYAGDASTVTASLTADGAASFSETVSIGSGSAAPDDYGLIAYANANTLSNKSAVYARNIGSGRNFTGDSASGATTFEVFDSGRTILTTSLGDKQLQLSGTEADLWLTSTGGNSTTWRILGSTGGSTHRFRVYDNTNSRDTLNIHEDGEITTGVSPGFIARYSVNETTWNVASDGWTKIIFDEENMDRGGNFSTTNSEFTAPVAGMYLFGAELQLEGPNGITGGYLTSGTNWMYIAFIVNGGTALVESKGGTRTDVNFNAMYNSYTPTHLLQLAAGDKVCMYRTGNYSSIKFKGGPESVFWGYLVG